MSTTQIFELVLGLLAAAIALHWVAIRLRLPPASALMIGGGAIAFVPGMPHWQLDPELALVLFLPPLLMDGAYYTAFGRFRTHLPGILSLAVGAVVFTTLAVGVVTHWLVPELPWAACFALGAIVSPPDAVSARAVLQGVRLPRRLVALLEGESLLNDATGLVLFRFAVAATLTGVFNAGDAAWSFVLLSLGGVAVGLAVAWLFFYVARRLHEDMLVIAGSLLIPWAAYIAGEAFHVSGVIATVAAGILIGWRQHEVFPARMRLQGTAFWRIMIFVLEALVFILIGTSLRGVVERIGDFDAKVMAMLLPVIGVVCVVTLSRVAWVFGIDAILSALHRLGLRQARSLGWRQASVLSWAGMRGVVTLAVALTLPDNIPGRDFMLITAFAVILSTVIVQGSTLGLLIRLVRPVDTDPPAKVSLPYCEAAIAKAKADVVAKLAYDANGELIHPMLLDQYTRRLNFTERYAEDAEAMMRGLDPHFDVVMAAIAAGRAELIRLHRAGLIEDETLHDLERDLDIEEMAVTLQRSDL
ncbi:MAG: Na+/H+ antiporter [Proteobacteria bacterium]|nr:Na+/H+ antiporter [Pseudomonadota bacterium]